MAASRIHASESKVSDVFGDNYRFTIPRFQRPYSWTKDEAGDLLTDLISAVSSADNPEDTDPYFLGNVVLVKGEGIADAEIIDGQQRLTTLTILLSVAREFVTADFAESLELRLFQHRDLLKKIVDQPRLKLRDQDQAFFEQNVQRRAGVAKINSIDSGPLSDSQRNLVENAKLIHQRLQEMEPDACERLLRFVDQRTYLVVVATQDFEAAHRIFAVLNERGLGLTHTDILKSEIIGKIPGADQDEYTQKWEAQEDDLGRDEFEQLFFHIRMVYLKQRPRDSILKGFRTEVLTRYPDSRQFIDELLVPLADAFGTVTHADYPAVAEADDINRTLRWLNHLNNREWVPAAISMLRHPTHNHADIRQFLVDLERLAASMFIRRLETATRLSRYHEIITAIRDGAPLFDSHGPLQLRDAEKAQTRNKLDGSLNDVPKLRKYVLLRLDSALSAGGATYHPQEINVEHVLPLRPQRNSQWFRDFNQNDRRHWVDRLANLVLLTHNNNKVAANLDFRLKKAKYFATKNGVITFALTSQVLLADGWTPSTLAIRQQELLATLVDLWRLENAADA